MKLLPHLIIVLLLLVTSSGKLYSQLSGNYTIGGVTPDYNTINDAVIDLDINGVSGPVIFNVRDGIYTEQIEIPSIVGVSSTNTITFQSESQDPLLTVIKYTTTSDSNNYVVKLDGADHIHFYKLKIRNSGTAYGGVFVFENGANFNSIDSCIVMGYNFAPSAPGADRFDLIYSPNTIDTNNSITNCDIMWGKRGIKFEGFSVDSTEVNNSIVNNNYSLVYLCLELKGQSELNIRRNITAEYSGGIYLNECRGNISIQNNEIYSKYNEALYIINSNTNPPDSIKIINNFFTSQGSNASTCSFRWSNAAFYLYHNSICNISSLSNRSALYLGSGSLFSYNNIYSHLVTGRACTYDVGTSLYSDYNAYFSNSSTLIELAGTGFSDLQSFQTLGYDLNSIQNRPDFISNSDLHIQSDIDLNQKGGIIYKNTDIDSDLRSNPPDIGADEYDQPDYDLTGIKLIMEEKPCTGLSPVFVRFRNEGELSVDSAFITLEINGVVSSIYNWYGNVSPMDTSNLTQIGEVLVEPDTIYNIRIWLSNPNGYADTLNTFDTLSLGPFQSRLVGEYDLGGGDNHYPSITESIDALIQRGICDSVFFNIFPGIYQEDIQIPLFEGVSDTSWVVWRSKTGIAADVTHISTWDFNHTVELLDAHNVVFEKIYYKYVNNPRFPSNTWSDVSAISCLGSLERENIKFSGCVFDSVHPIQLWQSSNITIENCLFQTGGIKIIHGNGWVDHHSVIIKNNHFLNCHNGIDISGLDSLTIEDNYFDASSLYWDGWSRISIYIDGANKSFNVARNQIYGRSSVGIKTYNCWGNDSSQLGIYNNFISVGPSTANGVIGVSIQNSGKVKISFNSINTYPTYMPTQGSMAMPGYNFSASVASELIVSNNIFSSDSTNYMVYGDISPIHNVFTEYNYNNFYSQNLTNSICNCGVTNWPGIYNSNIISIPPPYVGNNNLHLSNNSLSGTSILSPNYLTDLDGQIRNSPTTVGADEFVALVLDTIMVHHPDCDSVNGEINILLSSGTVPIDYSINGGQTYELEGLFDSLDINLYSIIVSDITGQSFTDTILLENPSNINIDSVVINAATCLQENGEFEILGIGGLPPYEYSIDSSLSWLDTNLYTGLAPGNYYIFIKDSIGCKKGSMYELENIGELQMNSINFNSPTCALDNGAIFISTAAGLNPINYSIDSGATWSSINQFNNLPLGSYNIIIEDSLGCVLFDTMSLINNGLPSSSTDIQTACNSYTWLDGLTYTTSGQPTYTTINSEGCDSIITLDLTINIMDTSVTQSGMTLTANNPLANYQWINCDNNSALPLQTNQDYTALIFGTYAVELNENGCIDTSACFTIDNVNISENILGYELTNYPNPTTGHIQVEFHDYFEVISIELVDVYGKVILSKKYSKRNALKLDLTSISNGVYFAQITADDKTSVLKIIKED